MFSFSSDFAIQWKIYDKTSKPELIMENPVKAKEFVLADGLPSAPIITSPGWWYVR